MIIPSYKVENICKQFSSLYNMKKNYKENFAVILSVLVSQILCVIEEIFQIKVLSVTMWTSRRYNLLHCLIQKANFAQIDAHPYFLST